MKRASSTTENELLNKVWLIARDSIIAYLQQTKKINPDQIQLAIFTAITSFFSILNNNGDESQAIRTAVSIAKSIPSVANLVSNSYKSISNPKQRIEQSIDTASKLLGKSAKASLSGFPMEAKENIGKDIEMTAGLFSHLPKEQHNSSDVYGSGRDNTFQNELNTQWIMPDTKDSDLSGGEWWNPFSWSIFNPSEETGSYDWTSQTPADADFSKYSYSFQAPSFDSGSNSTSSSWLGDAFKSFANSTAETFANTTSKAVETIGNATSKAAETIGNVVSDTASSPGFFSRLGGWFQNHPLTSMALLQLAPKVLEYTPSLLHFIGNNTIGALRRHVKSASNAPDPDDSWFTSARKKVRGVLKPVYETTDKYMWDPISNAVNDKKTKKNLKKLWQAISVTLPAAGQDYIVQQYKNKIYQQQLQKQRMAHNLAEQEREDTIRTQNAKVIADRNKEIRQTLARNSDKLAEYDRQVRRAEQLKKYNAEVRKIKEEERKEIQEYEREYANRESERLSAEAKREKRKAYTSGFSSLLNGIMTGWSTTKVANAFGLPGTVVNAVGAAAGAAYGGYNWYVQATEHFDNAATLTDRAQQFAMRGQFKEAKEYDNLAERQIKLGQSEIDKQIQYDEKLQAQRQKVIMENDRKIKDLTANTSQFLSKLEEAQYYGEQEELLKNRKPLIRPQPRIYPDMPVEEPQYPALEPVPDEIKEGDPLLLKYRKHHFIEPTPPADLFATPNLNNAFSMIPYIFRKKEKKKDEVALELPYVNPLPVEHVKPADGQRKLRTFAYKVSKPAPRYTTMPVNAKKWKKFKKKI